MDIKICHKPYFWFWFLLEFLINLQVCLLFFMGLYTMILIDIAVALHIRYSAVTVTLHSLLGKFSFGKLKLL